MLFDEAQRAVGGSSWTARCQTAAARRRATIAEAAVIEADSAVQAAFLTSR